MPTAQEILAGAAAIANDWVIVAIAWHVALAIAITAVLLGWRPTHRSAALLIALLPGSVTAFALAYGNPFNGAIFAVTTIALVVLAARDRRGPIGDVPWWQLWGGIAMVSFGWVYPHFLDASPIVYLVAAPVGLVPCPTLSVAIGLALVAGGAGPRAWRFALAGVGAFYGIYGVMRLGVMLDLGLLFGACLLAATAAHRACLAPARMHP